MVRSALDLLDVDEHGLDAMDTRVLLAIIDKFDGGPVGLNSLAVALGEDSGTLEEVYEPFLIREGLVARGPRGRFGHSPGLRALRPGASGRPGGRSRSRRGAARALWIAPRTR